MQNRLFARQQQRGMTMIGILLLLIICGFIAIILMKVVPMYTQYSSVKSTIESVRKENIGQMSPRDIQNALQKRFDIGYIDNIKARDLKIRNDRSGKVLDLVYQDERAIFYGLYAVLKVNEQIPLQ